jgi:DNA (cytosine-5)-methyltransferase 1
MLQSSITSVSPHLPQTHVIGSEFTHASLFTGIGGFDLAAEWCGWSNVFQVENDKWCQTKLDKNFPKTDKYFDIKDFDGTQYKDKITVLSGGFPCQPFSVAGLQKGTQDERYLWGEMFRVIREIRPSYVVAENVLGLLTNQDGVAFRQVFIDLESQGYKVLSLDIPASSKNAPHKRNRLFFVAYLASQIECFNFRESQKRQVQQFRIGSKPCITSDLDGFGCKKQRSISKPNEKELNSSFLHWESHWSEWVAKPSMGGDIHGLSNRVDRIKALGNAIVPQVAYEIFKAVENVHFHCR